MPSKDLEAVVTSIVDGITDALPSDDHVICEALGRVAAVYLMHFSDTEFEVWIKAVRDTREYVIKHGQLQ